MMAEFRIGVLFALAFVACDARGPSTDVPPNSREPAEALAPSQTVAPAPASAEGCPAFTGPTQIGSLPELGLPEASGLVASPTHPGHWWTHDDSGAGPIVHLLGPDGARRLRLRLVNAHALDWEDIAAIPGPAEHGGLIYVADMGDNFRRRSKISLYRFEEPTSLDSPRDRAHAERVDLAYPDGAHDAEALLVDPISRDVVIVTKARDGQSRAYWTVDPFAVPQDGPRTMTAGPPLTFGNALMRGSEMVTGGDVRADGGAIILRTYSTAHWWSRPAETPLVEVFAAPPCAVPLAPEPQGEAIAFWPAGPGYATVSEGEGAPIWAFTRAEEEDPP